MIFLDFFKKEMQWLHCTNITILNNWQFLNYVAYNFKTLTCVYFLLFLTISFQTQKQFWQVQLLILSAKNRFPKFFFAFEKKLLTHSTAFFRPALKRNFSKAKKVNQLQLLLLLWSFLVSPFDCDDISPQGPCWGVLKKKFLTIIFFCFFITCSLLIHFIFKRWMEGIMLFWNACRVCPKSLATLFFYFGSISSSSSSQEIQKRITPSTSKKWAHSIKIKQFFFLDIFSRPFAFHYLKSFEA